MSNRVSLILLIYGSMLVGGNIVELITPPWSFLTVILSLLSIACGLFLIGTSLQSLGYLSVSTSTTNISKNRKS